jgi:hypothetical protein
MLRGPAVAGGTRIVDAPGREAQADARFSFDNREPDSIKSPLPATGSHVRGSRGRLT